MKILIEGTPWVMEALTHTQCLARGLVHGKGAVSGSCCNFIRNISPFPLDQLCGLVCFPP